MPAWGYWILAVLAACYVIGCAMDCLERRLRRRRWR